MTRPFKIVAFVLIGLLTVYGLIAIPSSNYISERYDHERNSGRSQLGLKLIGEEWSLDSISFIGYGNYSLSELKEIPDWRLTLENEKRYCAHWSPGTQQNPPSYKKIYFTKSFWFWKNERTHEIDFYENHNHDLKHEVLMIGFDFEKNQHFSRIDTVILPGMVDSLVAHARSKGLELCGTGLLALQGSLDFDTSKGKLTTSEAQKILTKWKNGNQLTNH